MKVRNLRLAVPLILSLSLVFGGAMALAQDEISVSGIIRWNGTPVATTIGEIDFFVGVTRTNTEGEREYTELKDLEITYDAEQSRYQIMGIPDDFIEFYISILIDGPSFAHPYPGSYVGNSSLNHDGLGVDVDVNLSRRIHLTSPFDNASDPDWEKGGHDIVWPEDIVYSAGSEEIITFEWDAIETAAQYEVQIDEVSSSGQNATYIFAARLYDSSFDIHLPPSQDGKMYRFWLWAQDEEGTIIGDLVIVGIPGLYHFTVGNGDQ